MSTNKNHRTVTYQADVQASGNWYLSLYGWTKSPLVEFYIVEVCGKQCNLKSNVLRHCTDFHQGLRLLRPVLCRDRCRHR
jgi:hypothetical protein